MKRIISAFLFLSSYAFGQIVNNHFETGTSNWSDDSNLSLTVETSIIHGGIKSLNCTFDSQTQANCDLRSDLITGISANTEYTVSAWFYDNDIAGRANLVFEWYDVTNSFLSSSFSSTYTTDQDSWQQLIYSVTSPSDAVGCKVGSRFYDVSSNWDGNCTIYVDDFSGAPTPLPVELTTFSASLSDQNVELNWETATEVNNYGFDVERTSTPLSMKSSHVQTRKWIKLDFIKGHGNSNSPKYYSYSDNEVQVSGKYFYRLKQIDIDGTFEYSDEIEVNVGTPNKFELDQNFPNPFNPTTSIKFNIPQDSQVRLVVFNVLGEEVAELLNENITAGYHIINFDASLLNSGIYFYKLETNDFTQIRKMMLIK